MCNSNSLNYFTNFPVFRRSWCICYVQYDRWACGWTVASVNATSVTMGSHPVNDRTLRSIAGSIVAVAYKEGSHRHGRTTLQVSAKDFEAPLWLWWYQWESNLQTIAWFLRDADAWRRIWIFKDFCDLCAIIWYRCQTLSFSHPGQPPPCPCNQITIYV